jgi:hypothetical protein
MIALPALVTAATTALVALSLLALPATADLLWGANGHPFTAYPGITIQSQLDYLKDLGMRSYRVNITTVSDSVRLGELIREGKARGIDILPVITPAHANFEQDSAEALYSKSFNLAVSLVSQFKNDVRVWELSNEAENYAIIKPCEMQDDGVQYNCAWGPAGGVTSLEYYGPRWAKVSAVLKGLSDGTISVDPTIRKAIGTAGWGHTGAFARMQHDGIKWDISVWHMYGKDPEWALKILAQFGHPVWITEFNEPSGSQSGEQRQSEGLRQSMTRLRELQHVYNVEAAHVYELMDETYWGPSAEAVMGLVHVERDSKHGWKAGTPKAAYHTIKQLIRGSDTYPAVQRSCDLDSYARSDALRSIQLAYAFCLVLGRKIDGDGMRGWMTSMREGITMPEVLERLLDSHEFKSKYATFGLSNSNLVTFLYKLMLDRDPDGGDLSSYLPQPDDGSATRDDVSRGIINSTEFRSKHSILFRSPTAAEQ